MELLFSDLLYDSTEWEDGKFIRSLKEKLSEFDENVVLTESNIGRGADWPVVVAQFFNNIDWSEFLILGMSSIFLLGDKINKNIDAWIGISKKIVTIIDQLKPIRIDRNAAVLMAISRIVEINGPVSKVDLIVHDVKFSEIPWGKKEIDTYPDALYIVTADLKDKLYIFGIKSKGTIEFEYEFEKNFMDF